MVCGFAWHAVDSYAVMLLCCPAAASAKTVTKTVGVKNGKDITSTLQKALDLADKNKNNTYEITVKPGTYKIKGTLKIYSNTHLYMEGVTFRRVKSGVVMLRFGGSKNYKKYNQAKNVTLTGGTWDGAGKTGDLMRFGHGQSLTLDGVTFTNTKSSHHIEIAACKDVLFTGCTFKNYKGKMGASHVEALQIDIMRKEHFNYYPSYDETPCVNVTVTGCTFDGLNSGVGTHSAVLGSFHQNIQIVNNTFKDIHGYAVIGMNWKDSKINYNTMTDCGTGIEFRTISKSASSVYKPNNGKVKTDVNLNGEIMGNTIEVNQHSGYKYRISAITLYGKKLTKKSGSIPKGDYRILGMNISDNTIVQNCKGVALMLEGVANSTIQNNNITCNFAKAGYNMGGDGGSALRLDYSTNNAVSNNTVTNKNAANGKQVSGICTYKSSDNNTISGNTVIDFTRDGIIAKNSENITLTANTVTGSGRYGIFSSDKSSMLYNGNIVSGSKKRDFNINNGSTINRFTNYTAFEQIQ